MVSYPQDVLEGEPTSSLPPDPDLSQGTTRFIISRSPGTGTKGTKVHPYGFWPCIMDDSTFIDKKPLEREVPSIVSRTETETTSPVRRQIKWNSPRSGSLRTMFRSPYCRLDYSRHEDFIIVRKHKYKYITYK